MAHKLFFVLDRKLPAKLNSVSNDPLGSQSDPIDPRRELIGTVVTESGGGVDVYLKRVDRANSPSVWLFSRETLADIPAVFNEVNEARIERYLPDSLLTKYFGVTLFGWLYFFVFLPLLYFVLSLINRISGAAAAYAVRRWTDSELTRKPTFLPQPLRILILAITVFLTLRNLSLSLLARQVGNTVAGALLTVALVWAMFQVNARCEIYFKHRLEKRGRISATAVLRPARRVMDLVALIAGVISILQILGINPTATLAGLGVGGIAIALAAQKTLENVIGGASLIIDDALRVGDVFKVGDVTGTVEVIGLRSTRVRTADRTIVIIPNGQMATMTLENLSARDNFRFCHVIGLDYGSGEFALNSILAQVRSLLEHHPRVLPLSARARFQRFAESSLELEVVAYIMAADWNQFLEAQEDLLIKIRQLVDAAGVEFALPSRTIHLKDADKSAWGRPSSNVVLAPGGGDHELQAR